MGSGSSKPAHVGNASFDSLEKIVAVARAISAQVSMKQVAATIEEQTKSLVGATDCKLYVVDGAKLAHYSGNKKTDIPSGGIVGRVAKEGKILNTTKCTSESGYDKDIDGSGENVMFVPACPDGSKNAVSVLVLSSASPFVDTNVQSMDLVAQQMAVTIPNCLLFEESNTLSTKTEALIDFVKAMSTSDLPFDSLAHTIRSAVLRVVDADLCTLFLVDKARGELWSMSTAAQEIFRIPASTGLAGHAASTGELVNVKDAHEDARFNNSMDLKTGYRTKSVLCMPIRDKEQTVVGVLQLVNKKNGEEEFTHDDERILESFCLTAGLHLHNSKLSPDEPKTEAVKDEEKSVRKRSTAESAHIPQAISEEEEAE